MKIEILIEGNKESIKKDLVGCTLTATNNIVVSKWFSEMDNNSCLLCLSKLDTTNVDNTIENAKALSEIKRGFEGELYKQGKKSVVVFDETNQYFAKALYPLFCEFETKLRKFIHIALFNLEDSINEKINSSIKSAAKKDGYKSLSQFLENADLSQITTFLFDNLELSKAIGVYFNDNKNKRNSTDDFIQYIKEQQCKPLWDALFENAFNDCILKYHIDEIRNYRNDVMHFHKISCESYDAICKLLRETIADLDKQINKRVVLENNEQNASSLLSVIKCYESIATAAQIIRDAVSAYSASMEHIKKAMTPIISTINSFKQFDMYQLTRGFFLSEPNDDDGTNADNN